MQGVITFHGSSICSEATWLVNDILTEGIQDKQHGVKY